MRIPLAGALLLASLTPIEADTASLADRLEAIIEQHADTTTGVSLAVVTDEGEELLRTWGHADAALSRPLEAGTRLPVASVSKAVTALTALELHEKGLLDLDAPWAGAELSIDDRRAEGDDTVVTGRHLLTHHAGLEETLLTGPTHLAADMDLGAWAEQRELTLRYPDVGLHYSGLDGYAALGVAIEQATGMSFEAAADEHLMEPLGMEDASFIPAAGDAEISRPDDGGWSAAPWPDVTERPAAGLRISAEDSARLLRALLVSDAGLSEGVRETAMTVEVRPPHGGGGHTQVLFEEEREGFAVLEHAGADGTAWLTLVPEAGVGVAVATPSEQRGATELTSELVDEVVRWAAENGEIAPAASVLEPIVPDWQTPYEPVVPNGSFQQRLFADRGPEAALRSLTAQRDVRAEGDDLVLGDRRYAASAPGRWCDPEGCIAGVRSGSGEVWLLLGERGMLEQTLTPRPWWQDRTLAAGVLILHGLLILSAVIGGIIALLRRRRRMEAPGAAPGLAFGWAMASALTLAGITLVLSWPALSPGSAVDTSGPWGFALLGLVLITTALGAGWLLRIARHWRDLGRWRRGLAVLLAIAGIIVTAQLILWTLPM